MKNISLKQIAIFISMLIISFGSLAKDFVLVGSPIEPPWKYYEYNKDLEIDILVGIDLDILREVSRRTNLKFEFKKLDYSRALVELKNNNIDLLAGVTKGLAQKNAIKTPSWAYVEKLPQNVYYASNKKLKLKRYEDLYTNLVGVIKSFGHDDRLDDDPLLIKEFSTNGLDLFEKLTKGQLDAVIASDWEKSYFAPKVSTKEVEIITDFTLNNTVDRYLAYSSKVPQYMQRKIEESLDQMIEDGTLDKILDKYFKKFHPVPEQSEQK